MAIATLDVVVLDCPDPAALAGFYDEVMGGKVSGEGLGGSGGAGRGARLAFQKAPGFVAPEWPSAERSQQFHLDLNVEDMDAAEKEVLALGATVLDAADRERGFRVYADPAGHPFCLCRA
ncbi:VOC family protein [Streptomyces sp. MNU76]|uniref:VOC family protein n=1 Tax=Streptomyces sp. MNU76 TaxID=2560026 RepID=UPI001E598F93|nr:VOC family protein [Streptomyces sp. MNU76]MCC9710057.1 VOC family protein [Streptomyces sp. MNU76]